MCFFDFENFHLNCLNLFSIWWRQNLYHGVLYITCCLIGNFLALRTHLIYSYFVDDKSKREKTDLKILLVRLLIGNPFVSGQSKNYKHPPCTTCKTTDCFNGEHVNYDSIIVEGTWMFREFVVYDSNHCYPEYIITYDRV